jgi:hypothetical protein
MISNIILGVFYFFALVLTSPLRLFDDVSLASGIGSALSSASLYLSYFGMIMHLPTFFIVVGIMSASEISIASFKLINYVIRKIPGIS